MRKGLPHAHPLAKGGQETSLVGHLSQHKINQEEV